MSKVKNFLLKHFEVENNLLRLFNLNQLVILIFLTLSPLLISLITFFISNYQPSLLRYLPIKNYCFYIAFFLYSFITVIVLYFISRVFLLYIKNKYFKKPTWSIIKTLKFLWENREYSSIKFFNSIAVSIILFYSYFFTLLYSYSQEINQNSNSMAIILIVVLAIFFSADIGRYFWLTMGFQEGIIRYLLHFIIIGTSSIFIILSIFASSDLNSLDYFSKLLSLAEILFVPIIVAIAGTIVGTWIKRFFLNERNIFLKERNIEQFGWNKIFFSSVHILLVSWLFFSLFFTYFIMKIAFLVFYTSENYSSYALVSSIIVINLIFMIPGLIIILLISGRYILEGFNDWSYFFEVYYGKTCKKINESLELIKIQGTVLAIKSKKTIEDSEVDYQFLLSYDKNKKIEIIKLKEKVPFIKNKKVVREGDEISVIGKVKKIYDKYPKANCHKVIFAYHLE